MLSYWTWLRAGFIFYRECPWSPFHSTHHIKKKNYSKDWTCWICGWCPTNSDLASDGMDSEYMPHFMPTSTYQQVSELLYWWTSTISCQLLFRECLRVGKINMCCYCKENCQQSTVWALVFDWFESIVKVHCFCLYHIYSAILMAMMFH